jgi:hypothetical protein
MLYNDLYSHDTYRCKDFNEDYNFNLNRIPIGGLKKNNVFSKLRKSQFWQCWDSNLGVPRHNDIWVLAPWPGTKNIIREKVLASFKSES